MKINDRARKILFGAAVAISFLAIYIYNCMTPVMSDDLLFDAGAYHSVTDIIRAEYENYMNWNGRTVVQLIMRCCLLMPKWFFNIINSLCFVLLMLLIYWNIEGRRAYDFVIFTLINLTVWQFGVSFGETVLWEGGACNYLWGSAIILGFVTYYRYKLLRMDASGRGQVLAAGMFFFGLLAGWCNENTSGGGLLLILYFLGSGYIKGQSLKGWMLAGPAGMLTGLGFMIMAPGNRIRSAVVREEEEHQGILALVGRFLKINQAAEKYLLLMGAVVILLVVYLFLKGWALKRVMNAVVFAVVSIATAYALLLTAPPMDRAYFGAGIFMVIAFVQAIAYIPREEKGLCALKYGGILVFCIDMFFAYCGNGANLARILREVNERERYILEQKAQGNYDLTVPMLRPEFQTKYSFLYQNDVEEDPESWGSTIYGEYYGLSSLRGVPRADWTVY